MLNKEIKQIIIDYIKNMELTDEELENWDTTNYGYWDFFALKAECLYDDSVKRKLDELPYEMFTKEQITKYCDDDDFKIEAMTKEMQKYINKIAGGDVRNADD